MINLRSLPARHPWLAWVALATSLTLAGATFVFVQQERENDARAAFAVHAEDIADSISSRIRIYGNVLFALRGLFNASSAVTREEFRRFVEGLAVHQRHPGLLNLSFAQHVPHVEKPAFEKRMRRDTGFADFSINPPGEREEYHVLIYFEPQEGRRPSFGLDLSVDPPRRAVVERARNSGTIATSAPLTLLRDKESQDTSVLLRLAIYRSGTVPVRVAERQQDYLGVVGAAINIRQVLQAALSRSHLRRAHVQIYDGGPTGADPAERARLEPLFDSRDLQKDPRIKQSDAGLSRYTVARKLEVGDRFWHLHITPRHDPASAVDRILPFAATLVVATIGLLLFGLIRALAAAETQATHDKLTGLHNRHYMQEWLDRELNRAARHGRPVGAILMDVDHFKRVNDTHGHGAGDQVLRDIAALLKRSSRQSDVACRYGGEEFLLLMPESPIEATLRRAEQLRAEIGGLGMAYRGRPLGPITLSAGVAIFPAHGADADTLLRNADAALYRAKQEGRNRVVAARSGPGAV